MGRQQNPLSKVLQQDTRHSPNLDLKRHIPDCFPLATSRGARAPILHHGYAPANAHTARYGLCVQQKNIASSGPLHVQFLSLGETCPIFQRDIVKLLQIQILKYFSHPAHHHPLYKVPGRLGLLRGTNLPFALSSLTPLGEPYTPSHIPRALWIPCDH